MPLNIKLLSVFLATVFIFFPHNWLAETFAIPKSSAANTATLLLQAIAAAWTITCAKQTSSRPFKLFWQYLSIALLLLGCSQLFTLLDVKPVNSLIESFITLFVYFFVLLAIESTPHLSNAPHNKFLNNRIPSVFFILFCYCYLVLLPDEFLAGKSYSGQTKTLFDLLFSTLIFVRTSQCLLYSSGVFWRTLYGILLTGSALLLYTNLTYLNAFGNAPRESYFLQLFSLVPYLCLIIASAITISRLDHGKQTNKDNSPEVYALTLMVLSVAMHLYGIETGAFFIVDASVQAVIVLIWLFVGTGLISVSLRSRTKANNELIAKAKKTTHRVSELEQQTTLLTDAISNSEFKAIVNASNNAILTTDTSGIVLSANPAAVQMFQSLEQELIGTAVNNLFSANDEMHYFFNFQSNVYSLQRKELGISVECVSLRSDGTEFPAQAELQWANRQDKPLIVITFINLSARKLAEKQTLESKDKFIANISHEFRTPLTIINGIIDRFAAKTESEAEQEELTTAKRNGLRLVRMVEQLLELSRLTDNPQLSFNTYRLSTLMAMPLDSFSRLAYQSQLSFHSEIPDDLWLKCDAQAFEKIIFNLLANAIKYTPKSGSIQVIAYAEQDTVFIDVIDSGIGINKASQDKIFERFQRAEDVKNQSTFGVGIGLSLVNELVKAHGWRIGLVSEHGHGSKFTLSIPLEAANEHETDIAISISENEVNALLIEQDSTSNEKATGAEQVVLVIEDNADMQSHIKQVIEQQHHCLIASSGELGLQLAQEYLPDLIICDLMLTGIDGFEVLKELKHHELTAHIPVIMLTARSDLDSRLQGLNLKADEYLSKPFNQHELLSRIQSLIANRQELQKHYLAQFTASQKAERKQASQEKAAELAPESDIAFDAEEKFLHKLEAVIAQHYVDPHLDVAFIANSLAMSERQLQRKIKVILNTTPNNFVKEFRLKQAQALLIGGAQIGRIALDVGFSSQTYFGRCFKESFGCTPKQFQQQIQKHGET